MKILIGTKNPGKIEAAKLAFETYFPDVEIQGINVASKVSDEPVNKDIFIGAKNRVENLCRLNQEADYYVAVETGLTNTFGPWLMISAAYIKDKNGVISYGTSPAFPIPQKYVSKIISADFNKLIEEIYNTSALNQGMGGIALLSKGQISRIELSKQAILMALITYLNGSLWKDSNQ